MPEFSYAHGAADVPLLGEPIFQNLRRTAARFGDGEATSSCIRTIGPRIESWWRNAK